MARVFQYTLLLQKLKISAQVFDAGVKRRDFALGPRLHDAAFHDREHKFRKGLQIGAGREAIFGFLQKIFDCGGPAIEVVRESFVHTELFFGNFEGQAADGAAVAAIGGEEIAAIELEDAEDAFDGVLEFVGDGIDDNWVEGFEVELENGQEEFFFGFEKVVEATGVGFGTGQDFSDTGGGISAEPKEIEGRIDDALASWRARRHCLVEWSTKYVSNVKLFFLSFVLRAIGLNGSPQTY